MKPSLFTTDLLSVAKGSRRSKSASGSEICVRSVAMLGEGFWFAGSKPQQLFSCCLFDKELSL